MLETPAYRTRLALSIYQIITDTSALDNMVRCTAICIQSTYCSRYFAFHNNYRNLLRSSSIHNPRYPLQTVNDKMARNPLF
jgi:hypothetical protein